MAALTRPGWYRAALGTLAGIGFGVGLVVVLRAISGLPIWQTEQTGYPHVVVPLITGPLGFLAGIGCFDYWIRWAVGAPTIPEDHSQHGARSWKDYFRVPIVRGSRAPRIRPVRFADLSWSATGTPSGPRAASSHASLEMREVGWIGGCGDCRIETRAQEPRERPDPKLVGRQLAHLWSRSRPTSVAESPSAAIITTITSVAGSLCSPS